MEFCERLRMRRLKNFLSQKELAEQIGVAKSTYSLYESGKRRPNYDIMKKISSVLGITVDDLLDTTSTNSTDMLQDLSTGMNDGVEEQSSSITNIQSDLILKINGNSMINARIKDGDVLFVRKQPDVDDGDIAAIVYDNKASIKRIYKMPGYIQLRAENSDYEPINLKYDECEKLRIIGKVIAFQSSL